MPRTLARSEDGIALIAVVLVSMLVFALTGLVMTTGRRAGVTSTRDRNSVTALSVAEAGVQQGIAKIQATQATYSGSFTGSTAQGTYNVQVTKFPDSIVVQSNGTTGGETLGRKRVVKVTMRPPSAFRYALYSNTSIELKNNDTLHGDVFANESISFDQNGVLDGSMTSALSWIDIASNANVTGDVWSGGYNAPGAWAVQLGSGTKVDGLVRASVSAPTDPVTCGGEPQANYKVTTANGSRIGKDLLTWGSSSGPVNVLGVYTPNICTGAAVAKPLPELRFNPSNYTGVQEFSSVASFQTWLATNLSDLRGVFRITEPSPSQAKRIDLSGANVTADTFITTNAPVYTNLVTDSGSASRLFVVASSYAPPVGSSCDVNQDSSECAVHLKNNFQPSCVTAVLLYANQGPTAVKNNSKLCGAIYSDSILVKNNQTLDYDDRIARFLGFGSVTYEVSRWEELPVG